MTFNTDNAEDDHIKKCVDRLDESCTTFEHAKARLLAKHLRIESEGSSCQGYKEICSRWIEAKGADLCTLGQLVVALLQSGLARLVSGLRPICK